MNTPLLDRPLFSLTVGEFLELQKSVDKPIVMDFTAKDEKYVYGIDGLAKLFNCSRKTAQRIKNSGTIDKAVRQLGRKIVVNAELALELTNKKK
jgi:hypothetical protein